MTYRIRGIQEGGPVKRLRLYAVPLVMTYGLMLWWLFAILVPVNIGTTAHGEGGQSSAAWFNVVLIVIVVSTWIVNGAAKGDGE